MAAQGQLLELPLTGGVDQHSASRKLAPASLLMGLNARIVKIGRYDKAFGTKLVPLTAYDTAGFSAVVATPYTMASRGEEKLIAAQGGLFTRGEAHNTAWYLRDRLPEWTFSELGVIQGPDSIVDPDSAYDATNHLVCYVWCSGGSSTSVAQNVYAAVFSTITKALVLGPTLLAAASYTPHVISIGGVFTAIWNSGGTGNIQVSQLNAGGSLPFAWSGFSTIISDASTVQPLPYDVCISGSTFVVLYANNGAAATNVSVRAFNNSLTQTASLLAQSNPAAAALECCTLNVVGSNLYLAFAALNGTSHSVIYGYRINPSTLVSAVGPIVLKTEASTPDATLNMTIADHDGTFWTLAWSQASNCIRVQDYGTGLATHGAEKTTFRVQLVGKALALSGTTWALLTNNTVTLFNQGEVTRGTIYWADLHGNTSADVARIVAVWSPRIAPDEHWRNPGTLCSVTPDADGLYHVVAPRTSDVISQGYGGAPRRVTLFDLALSNDVGERQSAQLGGLTYFTGGVPSYYDGLRVGEVSYLQYPYASVSSSSSGGALASSVTYQYAIIFVQYDIQGNVHRSAPMIASHVMGVGDNTCTLLITMLGITTRQDVMLNTQPPSIEIYRTKQNDNVFRRLTAEVALASGVTQSSTGTMQNDPTTTSLTYTDKAADGALDNQPLLYTTGGILENVNPPSCTLVTAHRGRIFYAGTPDGKTVWASKKQTLSEAPGFSEGLQLYADDGGPITAIASLDDKLIIFKDRKIFYVTGDGPADDGSNSDWSDPVPLVTTVGAISPFTVVTPLGIVFQSRVGLSLLTRSLEVQPYWGSRVEDDLATYPIVQYMLLHPTLPEIRIGIGDEGGPSGNGIELRYDYRADAWLQRNYFDDLATTAKPMGAIAWDDDVYVSFTSSGNLVIEDQTTWLDQGQYITTTLDFAPIAAQGTQGLQMLRSVMVSGDRYTDHQLEVDFAYGDGTFASAPPNGEQRILTSATTAAWPAYQFQLTPTQSDWTQRIKVRLTDSYVSGTLGTGQGFAVSSILFQVEPMGVPFPHLGPTQRL